METLLGVEAFKLLRKYGLPIADFKMVQSAEKLASPCVLKVPEISHKTEKGAVKIVHCKEELGYAYESLSKLGRVMWQPLIEGREVIIGIKNDPAFGPVLMFGLGGVFTEIYKDVSFRVCPITNRDAEAMISEIKGFKVLEEFRGQPQVNFRILKATLLKASKLAMRERVEELDINPFIINDKKGYVVDARVVLK